jgi:hypothetical protein
LNRTKTKTGFGLTLLVKGKGYIGEFFNSRCVAFLAKAISTILKDDAYRVKIAKENCKATFAQSMYRIVDMYLEKFTQIEMS